MGRRLSTRRNWKMNLENWNECLKTDTSILVQNSPSPVICRTPSQLTFTETEYHQNEIMSLYEKLRELTTEMKAMKSFVIEILLIKNI